MLPDAEDSNWDYDEVAGKWFLHRFYWHMPDLNIANPRVREEISKVVGLLAGAGPFRLPGRRRPFVIELDGTDHDRSEDPQPSGSCSTCPARRCCCTGGRSASATTSGSRAAPPPGWPCSGPPAPTPASPPGTGHAAGHRWPVRARQGQRGRPAPRPESLLNWMERAVRARKELPELAGKPGRCWTPTSRRCWPTAATGGDRASWSCTTSAPRRSGRRRARRRQAGPALGRDPGQPARRPGRGGPAAGPRRVRLPLAAPATGGAGLAGAAGADGRRGRGQRQG